MVIFPFSVIDNGRVRVTRWTFQADGDHTGPHVHEYDYLVVPVTGGIFTITAPDGTKHDLAQQPGSPYAGTSGTAHDVANASGAPVIFIEIELKQQPPL